MSASIPAVSIIIPTYNQRADFLRSAIQSALAQEIDEIEIIVSDNHSTNGTAAVLDEFSGSNIRVVRPPIHLELLEHFAFAAENATGEYLCFLSSDDQLTDHAIAALLSVARAQPDAVAIYGDWIQINEKGQVIGFSPHQSHADKQQEILAHLRFLENITIGSLIKASSYKLVGGFHFEGAKINYSGDVYLGLKLLTIGSALHVQVNTMLVQLWSVDDRGGRWGKLAFDAINILTYAASSQQILMHLPERGHFRKIVRNFHFRRMIALSSKALWEGLITRQQYALLWDKFCELLPRESALFARIIWKFPLGVVSSGLAYMTYKVLKGVR